jgi:hypothetical protein
MLLVNVENQEINLAVFAEQVKKVKVAATKKLQDLIKDLDFTISLQEEYFNDETICVTTESGNLDIIHILEDRIICQDVTGQEYTISIDQLEILDVIYLCEVIETKPWGYLLG